MSDVVHYRGAQAPHAIRTMWWPACGLATIVAGPRVTRSKAKVTCRRCRAKLLGEQKRRAKPLPKVNRKRAAERKAAAFGEQAERCRWWVCCVCALKRTPPARFPEWAHWAQHGWVTVPHHEPPRSCGGRDRDTVPMCIEHHAERHAIGEREFCERHGIDLRGLAAAIHQAMTKERA